MIHALILVLVSAQAAQADYVTTHDDDRISQIQVLSICRKHHINRAELPDFENYEEDGKTQIDRRGFRADMEPPVRLATELGSTGVRR